jgi:hypothetical protein
VHFDVEKYRVGFLAADQLGRRRDRCGFPDQFHRAVLGEKLPQPLPRQPFVVDDGYAKHGSPRSQSVVLRNQLVEGGRDCSMAFAFALPFSRVFTVRARLRRGTAGSNDDRNDVDVDLEQVELARHLAHFLALAGNFLRDVDRHVALGDPSRAAGKHLGPDPLQPRPMSIAREFLFHELPPDVEVAASNSTSDILYRVSAEKLISGA